MSETGTGVTALLGTAPEVDLAAGAQLHELNATWEAGLGSFSPPAEVQARFVGSSGSAALSEGERFVDRVYDVLGQQGGDTTELDVLDFAAGWGRISRALVARTSPARLWCAELLPMARAYCALGVPGASIVAVPVAPPTKLAGDSFDLVTGYSVFTHLPRALHEQWAAELARLVRPGGAIAVTYWDSWFLGLCEASARGEIPGATTWHQMLAHFFAPHDESRRRLTDEGHLFTGSGGGSGLAAETYGEAVVTREYVADVWADLGLTLTVWDDSHETTPQAIAIVRAT